MKYYKPKRAEYLDIPCYIELSKEDFVERVCFDTLLTSELAEYRPAILSVPAEFDPYVAGDELVTNIAEPWLRLPLSSGKVYFKTANSPQEIIVCGVIDCIANDYVSSKYPDLSRSEIHEIVNAVDALMAD